MLECIYVRTLVCTYVNLLYSAKFSRGIIFTDYADEP